MKGERGRGTLEKEKPPVLGLIERGGEVFIQMMENVKQATIEPVIRARIQKGAEVMTDEYDIYNRLEEWGYGHKTVCHARGEYARDEDGDGFCEIQVNTIEGFWSLLRWWLRPRRGVSQEKLPLYLGFLNSYITCENAEKHCWDRFSRCCSLSSLIQLLSHPLLQISFSPVVLFVTTS